MNHSLPHLHRILVMHLPIISHASSGLTMVAMPALHHLRYWVASLLLILTGWNAQALAQSSAGASMHVLLVQNSGWMEPFYVDGSSQFKPLIKALGNALSSQNHTVMLSSFSEDTPDTPSPTVLVQSAAGKLLDWSSLDKLRVAARKNGVLADTDFKQAIQQTAKQQLQNTGGVIWLITNNKNSPGNDQNTIKRNREYYEFLHLNDQFMRILAWPISMPVKGRLYSAQGLMIYAIAYGRAGDTALQQAVTSNAFNKVFPAAPARLKPQNAETVTFIPSGVRNKPNIKASLDSDQRTIVIDFESSEHVQTAELEGVFQNAHTLYAIDRADVLVQWSQGSHVGALPIEPTALRNVPAGSKSNPHVITLSIPPLKSAWDTDVIFGNGYAIDGKISLKLDQTLSVSNNFGQKLRALFPNDPLPDLFKPSTKATQSVTELPVVIRVNYPTWPLILVMGGVTAIFGSVGVLLWLAKREKRFQVSIDTMPRSVLIKPFKVVELRNDNGEVIAKLTRGFGAPKVVWQAPDTLVSVKP